MIKMIHQINVLLKVLNMNKCWYYVGRREDWLVCYFYFVNLGILCLQSKFASFFSKATYRASLSSAHDSTTDQQRTHLTTRMEA